MHPNLNATIPELIPTAQPMWKRILYWISLVTALSATVLDVVVLWLMATSIAHGKVNGDWSGLAALALWGIMAVITFVGIVSGLVLFRLSLRTSKNGRSVALVALVTCLVLSLGSIFFSSTLADWYVPKLIAQKRVKDEASTKASNRQFFEEWKSTPSGKRFLQLEKAFPKNVIVTGTAMFGYDDYSLKDNTVVMLYGAAALYPEQKTYARSLIGKKVKLYLLPYEKFREAYTVPPDQKKCKADFGTAYVSSPCAERVPVLMYDNGIFVNLAVENKGRTDGYTAELKRLDECIKNKDSLCFDDSIK